jgi:hypothetical protein
MKPRWNQTDTVRNWSQLADNHLSAMVYWTIALRVTPHGNHFRV